MRGSEYLTRQQVGVEDDFVSGDPVQLKAEWTAPVGHFILNWVVIVGDFDGDSLIWNLEPEVGARSSVWSWFRDTTQHIVGEVQSGGGGC